MSSALSVARSLSRLTGIHVMMKETKTGRGHWVAHESMAEALPKRREHQEWLKRNLGVECRDEAWMCAGCAHVAPARQAAAVVFRRTDVREMCANGPVGALHRAFSIWKRGTRMAADQGIEPRTS